MKNLIADIMNEKFASTLTELESFLEKSQAPIVSKLQKGKTLSEISSIFKSLQLPLTDDLQQLYSWKNGVEGYNENLIGELTLFTFGIMIPLELAVSTYELETETNQSFNKDYFPLFSSGGGDYILIHLNKDESTFGNLFLFSSAVMLSNNPISIYDSLSSLFSTVLEIHQSGGYYYSKPGNLLEVKAEIETTAAKKWNPNSEFWNED